MSLAGSAGAPNDRLPPRKLTHTVQLRPGMKMTPEQYAQYHRQFERLTSAKARVQALSADTSNSTLLLAARVIDDQAVIESVAVTDVTGDGRADIVAFGERPPPNQIYSRISVYPQTADGDIGAPIHSNVNSQVPIRPVGMIATPILGARPDLLVFGHRWIEIFPIAMDGTVSTDPLRITPGTIVRDVVARDLNGDRRTDLIVSGTDVNDISTPLKVQRFLQTSSGTFAKVSEVTLPFTTYGVEGTLVDIDGDGIVDVVNGITANDSFGFGYRLGLPDGTYGPLVSVVQSGQFVFVQRVFVTDMDGDGLKDVILATGGGAWVNFQTSLGTFSAVPLPTSAPVINVTQVTRTDLDGNGLVDVILWLDGYNLLQVDVQTAPRSFTAVTQYDVPISYASFYEDTTVAEDVNSDGRPDVVALSGSLSILYNGTGSYPTLDSSLATSAQVDDSGPVAHILWTQSVTNAGPAVLAEGLLLQEVPPGFEFDGADVPCVYFVALVACEIPVLRAGEMTQITLSTRSVWRHVDDRNVTSRAVVLVGGRPIDPNLDNNATQRTLLVHSHPEGMQAVAPEVFIYERAGDTVIPVVDAPPASGLTRFMNYWLRGQNAPDDTGIASVTNGMVWSAPGQQGFSRIRLTTRDGSTVNPPLQFNVQFSDGGFGAPGGSTLTIVDDDGTDPRLTASGAQPFEEWPALFSSVTTLFTGARSATVAIGDVDGDGRNDVAVAFDGSGSDPPYVQVWLQQANGSLPSTPLTWTAPSISAIASIAIGNVTGDGQPELVLPLYDHFSIVRLVNGQLQEVDSARVPAWKVAVSDLNLDGYLDIVVADNQMQSFDGPQYWVPNVSIFYGNAQRTLDAAPYRFAMPYASRDSLVVGLFNRDALPDIATTSGQGNFPSVSVAYQNSNGTFAAPIGVWVAGPQHLDGLGFGDSIETGDFNGDGRTDFAIGSLLDLDSPSVWIFSGLRNDDFARPSQRLYAGPEGNLAAVDIDQDGRDDLLVDAAVMPGYPGVPMRAYLQDANGQLQYAGNLSTWGAGQHTNWKQTMAVGDVDGDGEQDVVVVEGFDGRAGHIVHSRAHSQSVQFSLLESANVGTGARARYRLRVTNNGTRTSLEIPLSWSVPPALGSAQIVAAKGACYFVGDEAQCLLPQLAPGGYVDVMLTGTFNAVGTYSMSIAAGPYGSYGKTTLSAVVTGSGGGGSGGGGSNGGGSHGGGGGGGRTSIPELLVLLGLTALRGRLARGRNGLERQ